MDKLSPGVPCFLVRLVEYQALSGRVVEVKSGPMPMPAPDDEQGSWYAVDAAWVREMFPGRNCIAPRQNLRPVCPPRMVPHDRARVLDRV